MGVKFWAARDGTVWQKVRIGHRRPPYRLERIRGWATTERNGILWNGILRQCWKVLWMAMPHRFYHVLEEIIFQHHNIRQQWKFRYPQVLPEGCRSCRTVTKLQRFRKAGKLAVEGMAGIPSCIVKAANWWKTFFAPARIGPYCSSSSKIDCSSRLRPGRRSMSI